MGNSNLGITNQERTETRPEEPQKETQGANINITNSGGRNSG